MWQVVIIGCGRMGAMHAETLASDPRVQLAYFVDSDIERAQRLARRYDGLALDDERVAFDAGAEVVFVCTPNTLHVDSVLAALARNLHVFSEKPMATSLAAAARVREAAAKSQGLYQVGFNLRFAPVYCFVKDRLEAGGFVPRLASFCLHRGDLRSPGWLVDPTVTGGFLYEVTVHMLDLARYLIGDVAAVQAQGVQSVYDETDAYALLLRFASGALGTLTSCAHATWHFPAEHIELIGDHARLSTAEWAAAFYVPGADAVTTGVDFHLLPDAKRRGFEPEVRAFLDAIAAGGPSPAGADDGYRAVELVEAVARSVAAGGASVALPLAPAGPHEAAS